MGTKEKLLERLKGMPTGFNTKSNKGRTSGSRVMFIDKQKRKILLHIPHPGNSLKSYSLKDILEKLKRNKNI